MKTDKPSFSVVIPAYNAGNFISAAIDSVLRQTLPPLEIIVIDDGSTDNTCEIVRGYGQQIRYFHQKNAGIGAARNAGICAANGDWIALLDADDIWHPRKLECQSAVISRNPAAALIGTDVFQIDGDGARLDGEGQEIIRLEVDHVPLRWLLESAVFCPSSTVVRQSYIEAIGGFSTQVQGSEDMLMWWTFAAAFLVLKLRTPLTGYRVHTGSISSNYHTMVVGKKRALVIAFATLPAMQTQWYLRNIARARVYREASWERHSAGDHFGAIAEVLISIVNYPFAMHSSKGIKLRWGRAKQLCRYVLSVFHKLLNW